MPSSKNLMLLAAILPCFVPMVAAQHPYPPNMNQLILAHGIMAAVAWVVLFPLGGMIIRLCSFKGVFWAHTGIQLLAYTMFCFVFATGCYFSWLYGTFIDQHVLLGMVIFFLASIQPFLGTLHHQNYKKYKRRTFSSILHINFGRALITMAMINGGLGLYIADNATPAQLKAYGCVAGIVWFLYIITVSFKETKTLERIVVKSIESDESLDIEKEPPMKSKSIEERNLGVYE